jgi:hypothetical protein
MILTGWINIYPTWLSPLFPTKEDAAVARSGNALATIEVTFNFEKGEGL